MAISVKKGYEDSSVTYDYAGMSCHIPRLSEANQEELKRLKELGYEGVTEDKKSKE